MSRFRMQGVDLLNCHHVRIGTIDGERILDNHNEHIATVDGDRIMNAHRHCLAQVQDEYLCDRQGNRKVAMTEIRNLIDGDAISELYLAALWMAFCVGEVLE